MLNVLQLWNLTTIYLHCYQVLQQLEQLPKRTQLRVICIRIALTMVLPKIAITGLFIVN